MRRVARSIERTIIQLAVVAACFASPHVSASAAALYATVGAKTASQPAGWVQFCRTYAMECNTQPLAARDIVFSDKVRSNFGSLNAWVNHQIKPRTDMDHYGVVQWWRYPDDGAGACHSYALLKRRLLIQAGWPRQALLMTIVHEANGAGHAVLTVKTDRGDFILDNLTDDILLWSETPYRYYKRQSQEDPNAWVWLEGASASTAVAAAIQTSQPGSRPE